MTHKEAVQESRKAKKEGGWRQAENPARAMEAGRKIEQDRAEARKTREARRGRLKKKGSSRGNGNRGQGKHWKRKRRKGSKAREMEIDRTPPCGRDREMIDRKCLSKLQE